MQQTKYYIEGMQAAHNAQIRACRYQKENNRDEWFKGFDSVDKAYSVCKISLNEALPVFVGNLNQCSDKALMLQSKDRGGCYVVYDNKTHKPYSESTRLEYKK